MNVCELIFQNPGTNEDSGGAGFRCFFTCLLGLPLCRVKLVKVCFLKLSQHRLLYLFNYFLFFPPFLRRAVCM